MFKKKFPNTIKSDEGFSISRADRFVLEYKQDTRKMNIEVEPGESLAIYTKSIKNWQPPYDNEILSKEDVGKIISNIKAAMDWAKWKYEIL